MTDRGRPRSILILVQNLPVPFDRRVWQEARALSCAGYQVSVICPSRVGFNRLREQIDGIDIYRYRPGAEASRPRGYLREYTVALVSMLFIALRVRLRRRIDVVHICNPPDLLFVVALPLKLLGARIIFDQHDANPELVVAKGHREGGLFASAAILLERLTFAVADVCIATNESYRDIALTRGSKPPSDVFVVRSAPPQERFAAATPNARWRRGRKHLVGYVGVMAIQDGLDYLIDAASTIVHSWSRKDVQFVCVGDGPELARLRERIVDAQLAEFFEFTGRVDDADLGQILATADVCVNPDEANQMNNISTMNKIMEYMALGKPIVQFDLLEGRVSAGDSSLYAAPNDATDLAKCIVSLLDEPELRQEMGARGRLRLSAELAWERQVPALLAAYSRALDKASQ